MPRTIGRAAVIALITLVVIVSIPAVIIASAWRSRRHASQVLAVARHLYPGVTKETEVESRLQDFQRFRQNYTSSDLGGVTRHSEYVFYNLPPWRTPFKFPTTFLPLTRFSVDLTYGDGMLSRMRIIEMQEELPGYPHPVAASADIRSSRYDSPPLDEFKGYAVHYQNTRGYEGDHPTGFTCCSEEFTELDERASPEQRAQALNFRLSCLTSIFHCNEPRKIRPAL